MTFFNKKAFSLVEVLIVIVLVAIIMVIAFVNFWSQSPKARNAIREDTSSKIRIAYGSSYISEQLSSSCANWTLPVVYSWRTNFSGCHVTLDWSNSWTLFLNALWVSWKMIEQNSALPSYEFTYLKNSPINEFSYVKELESTSYLEKINSLSSYAMNFLQGAFLYIDWNYSLSITGFPIISPIIRENEDGTLKSFTTVWTWAVLATATWYVISPTTAWTWSYYSYILTNVNLPLIAATQAPSYTCDVAPAHSSLTIGSPTSFWQAVQWINPIDACYVSCTSWYQWNDTSKTCDSINYFYTWSIAFQFTDISWIKYSWQDTSQNYSVPTYYNWKIYATSDNWNMFSMWTDWSSFSQIRNYFSAFPLIVDSNWIYYITTSNNQTSQKLKKTLLDGSNTIDLTTTLPDQQQFWSLQRDTNNLYFIWNNETWIYKIWKDWSNQIELTTTNSINSFTVDSSYIYYYTNWEPWYLYQIDKTNWTVITSVQRSSDNGIVIVGADNNYIYFSNNLDNWKLYKMNKDFSSPTKLAEPTQITTSPWKVYITWNSIYFTNSSGIYKVNSDGNWFQTMANVPGNRWITWDWTNLYYSNDWDNDKLYYLSINSPAWYKEDDWTDTSSEITTDDNNSSISVNLSTTVPSWTSYKFYLANSFSNVPAWSNLSWWLNWWWTTIDFMNGTDWSNFKNSWVSVWNAITITCGSTNLVTTVAWLNDWIHELTVADNVNNLNIWGQSCSATIGSSNFTEITDHSFLDGSKAIDLTSSPFNFTPTKNLWYKIVLTGDSSDKTKTPVISSVNMNK